MKLSKTKIALGLTFALFAVAALAAYQTCTIISGSADSYFPAINAAGTRVAYWVGDPDDTSVNSSIVLYQTAGGGSRTTISSTLTRVGRPSISRDGKYVCFFGKHTDGSMYPYIYDVAGTSLTRCSYTSRRLYGGYDMWPPVASNEIAGHNGKPYVAFRMDVTDPGGTPPNDVIYSIKVWDVDANTIAEASDSEPADQPCISSDGAKVGFASDSGNLLSNTPGIFQIFLSELVPLSNPKAWAVSQVVSRSIAGAKGNNDSTQPSMSGDGNAFAFASLASNLSSPAGTSGFASLYYRDRSANDTCLLFDNSSSVSGDFGVDGLMPSISSDGLWVAFLTCDDVAGSSWGGRTGPTAVLTSYDLTFGVESLAFDYTSSSYLRNASFVSLGEDADSVTFSSGDTGICASDNTGYDRVYLKSGHQ